MHHNHLRQTLYMICQKWNSKYIWNITAQMIVSKNRLSLLCYSHKFMVFLKEHSLPCYSIPTFLACVRVKLTIMHLNVLTPYKICRKWNTNTTGKHFALKMFRTEYSWKWASHVTFCMNTYVAKMWLLFA